MPLMGSVSLNRTVHSVLTDLLWNTYRLEGVLSSGQGSFAKRYMIYGMEVWSKVMKLSRFDRHFYGGDQI